MLDLYLSDKYAHHWPDIVTCAESEDPADFEKLKKYGLEGYRLATAAFGLLRKAENDTTVQDGDRVVNVKKDETIFVDFVRPPFTYPTQPSLLTSI
jgi:linoleate 10R-lipoxygenase